MQLTTGRSISKTRYFQVAGLRDSYHRQPQHMLAYLQRVARNNFLRGLHLEVAHDGLVERWNIELSI